VCFRLAWPQEMIFQEKLSIVSFAPLYVMGA